jgi:N-acetylneuraminic acid mutarotase
MIMRPFYSFLVLFLISFSSVCSAQWVQKAVYPGGYTDAVVSFAIGDTIYIGAGSTGSTDFYKYDPSSEQWTKKANIPQRAFAVSFSIGSKGYMALGQSDPAITGQASVSNELWEYDPGMDQWIKKTNFPGNARDAAFAFVIGNKAYVGGGTDAANNVFRDFYSYDPIADKWSLLNFLPDYLYFNAPFVIGNYGYLATGVASSNEISSMWQYDPSSDSWSPMADFPGAPRESAESFALNGIGYVGMGQTQYTTVFSDFYSYDPAADQWTPIMPFPAAHGRAWAAAVATSTSAFIGLGTYFSGGNLIANNDFWEFSLSGDVARIETGKAGAAYPNPTRDFVLLSLPASLPKANVTIYNALGEKVKSEQLEGARCDLTSLAPGVYNLEITSGDYHSNERIVKE